MRSANEALVSAHEGNVDCYNTVGVMYSNGEGVKKSDRWALFWLRKALNADRSYYVPVCNIGCVLRDQGKFKTAEKWFKKAVRLKDGDAWLELAKLYLGPLLDKRKARSALLHAINSDHRSITEYSQEEAEKLLRGLRPNEKRASKPKRHR